VDVAGDGRTPVQRAAFIVDTVHNYNRGRSAPCTQPASPIWSSAYASGRSGGLSAVSG